MSAPFKVGELVVCVDASDLGPGVPGIRAGEIVTISEIFFGFALWNGAGASPHSRASFGVKLVEKPSPPKEYYAGTRFDRIEDTLITEEVKDKSEVPA